MKHKNENNGKLFPADGKVKISDIERDEADNIAFPDYPKYPTSDDFSNKEKEVDLYPDDLK